MTRFTSMMGPWMAAAFLGVTVHSQVSVNVAGVPAVGPGTKAPTLTVCNQTNTPQQVQGWKFKTKDFANFTTWMGGLTKAGTAPVEYTQPIPSTEQQMTSGLCRAPTDYTGTLAAGQDASPFDPQALIKTGSCTEVPPYKDGLPLTCAEVDTKPAGYYNATQCIIDSIGSNGGDNYGGFVSTFYNQTQIQAAIPAATLSISGTPVKWNPYGMGPQYMMAMAMGQEIMNVDMQFLISIAGKETGAGMANQNMGGQIRSEDGSYTDNGTYGYWQIEDATYATYIKAYPQFFPKYGPCISRYRDVTQAITAGKCAADFGEVAKFYMQPAGQNRMMANSPQIANGAVSSALAWYGIYDALVQGTDLCFIDAIKYGIDKKIALAAMIPFYNVGRANFGFADPLKNPALKDNPNASDLFATGNNNYRPEVFLLMKALVDASKTSSTCGGASPIYDTLITLREVQRFFFGGYANPGTPAAQGDGGLLLHFELTPAQRVALWDELQCAYNKLKGKAPSTTGRDGISYRYDWITMMRVFKKFLPYHINARKTPVEHDFEILVANLSKNPRTCTGDRVRDVTYPSLTITSPNPSIPAVFPLINDPNFKVAFQGKDEGIVSKGEWTLDKNWFAWSRADSLGGGKYAFPASCAQAGFPKTTAPESLWVRVTDGCGNTTVQQLNFSCGVPVPPKVATPVATPPGGLFIGSVNVSLSTATPGATILFTIDGSTPDTVVRGATQQYTGPIAISQATILKARAVLAGFRPSDVMTETYTKAEKVATPVANPKGQQFNNTLSVALSTATPGATILFTVDGTIPDTVVRGSTRQYTGPIPITQTTTVKAIAIKAGMEKSDMMTEVYTKVNRVAMPVANPPGQRFSVLTPLSVVLSTATPGATILFTVDGTTPDTVVRGSTRQYTGPIPIAQSTTLKARAVMAGLEPSDVMTEIYVGFVPLSVKKAWYLDVNGDGKVERAVVQFNAKPASIPDQLRFTLGGQTKTVAESKNEIVVGPDSAHVTVSFSPPFPFGVTSVDNPATSGHNFNQVDIALTEGDFPVEDSVPPVIVKAESKEPGGGDPLKRIIITYSEPVDIRAAAVQPLVFKQEGREVTAANVLLTPGQSTGATQYTFHVEAASGVYPGYGDSVAIQINGETTDRVAGRSGIGPSIKLFQVIEGERPKSKPIRLEVVFPNGSSSIPAGNAIQPAIRLDKPFIMVGSDGTPLQGNGPARCGECIAIQNNVFVGPVFRILTPGPVAFQFKIFSHFGEFLGQASGKFETQDLPLLKKQNDSSGVYYEAPVVWTGSSLAGRKAGTGAYILSAILTSDKDPITRAPPGRHVEKRVFGMIRN